MNDKLKANAEHKEEKESQAEKLAKIRHSFAHVMAGAVQELFPDAKFGIGPAIDNGFYYDFDLNRSLTPEDLAKIEEKMSEVLGKKFEFIKEVVGRDKARELFKNQPYKLELINELPEGEDISIYKHDSFIDLCRGPHVESTSQLNAKSFKLLSTAGAYWKGDEKNKMLQRIYGTAWENPKDLRLHLQNLEEIEKRDHRKLGKELDLYSIHEEAGPGFIYWHPKGARIRSIIEEFWRQEHFKNGYELLYTPHLGKSWLWETSGHLGFYAENMYSPMTIDEAKYYVKPMNCPFHILIYKTKSHSYRELPLRWAELGTVYRYERSGVLHGLLRVRGFTQDDAHIVCAPEQIEDEILEVLRFSLRMWKYFGFKDIKAYLATRPLGGNSVGDESDWQRALNSLKNAVEKEGLAYEMDEGGGAFYGPKIDLKIKDALGREWQMTTIQFDFNEPARFGMKYVAADGQEKQPYMVHRALLGSIERFFGVLIEHYAGAFPVWLSPEQARVLPVAPAFNTYAEQVTARLVEAGFRVKVDLSDDRLNAKIRNASTDKIPYTVVVGEKEQNEGKVAVRLRKSQENKILSISEFIDFMKAKVEAKEEI